jgi:cytochrome c peroxidase
MESTFIRRIVLGCALFSVTSLATATEPIQPLQNPSTLKLDARKVKLGEALFSDTRLSKNDTISCASCHSLTQGGSDGRQFPVGINGQVNLVNSPTVYNAANNSYQFWDGRAATLEDQINDHLASPIVFASNWAEVSAKLNKDAALTATIRAIYPDGVQGANLRDALASYERSLLTPSRFDRYLQGETQAISADELAGYKKFKDFGCVGCHQGVNVGGNMFQELGVMRDYFTQRGNPTPADLGRYNVTKQESDKHVFKVPSLRNVALTAPYFHDGTALTLSDAMNVMFKYQLGRRGSEADKLLIIKFLNTLSGEKLTAK